jgi:hypothetical protein
MIYTPQQQKSKSFLSKRLPYMQQLRIRPEIKKAAINLQFTGLKQQVKTHFVFFLLNLKTFQIYMGIGRLQM